MGLDQSDYHEHATEDEKIECQRIRPKPQSEISREEKEQRRAARHVAMYGIRLTDSESSDGSSDIKGDSESNPLLQY